MASSHRTTEEWWKTGWETGDDKQQGFRSWIWTLDHWGKDTASGHGVHTHTELLEHRKCFAVLFFVWQKSFIYAGLEFHVYWAPLCCPPPPQKKELSLHLLTSQRPTHVQDLIVQEAHPYKYQWKSAILKISFHNCKTITLSSDPDLEILHMLTNTQAPVKLVFKFTRWTFSECMRAESRYCNYRTSCLLRTALSVIPIVASDVSICGLTEKSGKCFWKDLLFFWFSNAVMYVPKFVGLSEDVDIVLIILNWN